MRLEGGEPESLVARPGQATKPSHSAMLSSPNFWKQEKGAPLLRRNQNFLPEHQPLPQQLEQRLQHWPHLCQAHKDDDQKPTTNQTTPDEAAERIFLRDAERTFAHKDNRDLMIHLLRRVWPETEDYHQGLGYVASVLLLFFDLDTAERMLRQLNRDDKYTPGYWYAAPDAYVRDAMVYGRLVAERHPEVAELLGKACIVPEAYASKWFIGLCVHVLPYVALMDYFEAFLELGHIFLFKFSLALVQRVKDKLLAQKFTDVNHILEILRLDLSQFSEEEYTSEWFCTLVADARHVELEAEQVATLREEEGVVLAEKLRRTREREAAMAAEESDDEIVFSDETDEGE